MTKLSEYVWDTAMLNCWSRGKGLATFKVSCTAGVALQMVTAALNSRSNWTLNWVSAKWYCRDTVLPPGPAPSWEQH
jgi:hypothetical protein